MPASQKTPNYKLPVYAEDDITSYLQDYNPAMQKIDAQMKANADAAAAARSDADSLDTRVTALENAPAGVTELDADTDVTGFENGYILVNNNGKLGAIEPSGGTGTDPNAIHASGGGTFSASEGIGSTGPYNIVVDEEPAGVPITSDDVTIPESATAFGGQTVTEALESLSEGESSGAAAENVSYNNTSSGLAATNVQDAIDEMNVNIILSAIASNGSIIRTIVLPEKLRFISSNTIQFTCYMDNGDIKKPNSTIKLRLKNKTFTDITNSACSFIGHDGIIHDLAPSVDGDYLVFTNNSEVTSSDSLFWLYVNLIVT